MSGNEGTEEGTPPPAGNSNLIVNYIPSSMNEDSLSELFSTYGTIEKVKIIRDKATNASLGYGFVKFSTDESAEAAVQGLNGRQIENKTLKVSIAKPPEKNLNLYVAGLEPQHTKEDLETIFKPYGTVVETKILNDRATGGSRGIGFVKFSDGSEAEAAIKALNGLTLAGTSKPLVVRVADKKDSSKSMPFQSQFNPMNQMNPMNSMLNRNLRYNPIGNYPYQSHQAYQFQGYQQPGYGTPPGYPQGLDQSGPMNGGSFCLFVYNLPPESDEGYLYQLFGPYGAVTNVKIVRDQATNLCKGFGFVNMLKFEDAQMAISALNGAQIGAKNLQVSFKKEK